MQYEEHMIADMQLDRRCRHREEAKHRPTDRQTKGRGNIERHEYCSAMQPVEAQAA